jgi:hypothetical protein
MRGGQRWAYHLMWLEEALHDTADVDYLIVSSTCVLFDITFGVGGILRSGGDTGLEWLPTSLAMCSHLESNIESDWRFIKVCAVFHDMCRIVYGDTMAIKRSLVSLPRWVLVYMRPDIL